MGDTLKTRLQQSRFESPFHEAMLNLLVTASHVQDRFARTCDEHGISRGQYNVLRILRGATEGYARCEIASRMIERSPDVTRLIDRLERRQLVERGRSARDARQSVSRITARGLELLAAMEPDIQAIHREIGGRWTVREAREISRICEKLYGPDHEEAPAVAEPGTRQESS